MEIIIALLCFLAGGIFYRFIWMKITCAGTLLVDRHDPEKDIFRFDIDNFDNLNKKRWVVLRVNGRADLTRK